MTNNDETLEATNDDGSEESRPQSKKKLELFLKNLKMMHAHEFVPIASNDEAELEDGF